MNNFRTAYLAISLLSPAPFFAASTNDVETALSHVVWLMMAPYFFAVPLAALCLIALLVLGAFEDCRELRRYGIFISAFALLVSVLLFGTVVFGDSGATV